MRYHPIAVVALATALLATLAGCAAPETRDQPVPDRLSLDEEVVLGRAVAPALERGLGGLLENLAVQAYVRTVGQRVARATHLSGLPYRFAVLDTGQRRGAALPGGVIYVTRGLIEPLESEAQLAAALARQLAHLAAGHVRAALDEAFGLKDLRRAAAAGEAPAGNGSAAGIADRVAYAVRDLSCSAEAEAEADRLALDYLAAAGYNPPEMLVYLRRAGAGQDRLDAIRAMIDRKYPDRHGRVAVEVYESEVLDRLRSPRVGETDPAR